METFGFHGQFHILKIITSIYRFDSTSFRGKEGWIVGKPVILLYTADSGDTWGRNGNRRKQEEMMTEQGIICLTSNGGYNWGAAVQLTVSATLNRPVTKEIALELHYIQGLFPDKCSSFLWKKGCARITLGGSRSR